MAELLQSPMYPACIYAAQTAMGEDKPQKVELLRCGSTRGSHRGDLGGWEGGAGGRLSRCSPPHNLHAPLLNARQHKVSFSVACNIVTFEDCCSY
jgi:hypothetical protein